MLFFVYTEPVIDFIFSFSAAISFFTFSIITASFSSHSSLVLA